MNLWSATVLLVLAFSSHSIAELSLDFEKCHFGDSACATKVLNALLTQYATTGVRALNVLPVDPLHLNSIKLAPNPNSPVNINFHFTNVDVVGLSQAKGVSVSGFTRDLKDKIVFKGTVPEIKLVGPYESSGTVLSLPIRGKGHSEIKLKNIELVASIHAKLTKKGNDEYLEIVKGNLKLGQPDNVHFQLDGLFDGNKDLEATTNEFLNGNWKEIFEELKESFIKAFELIMTSLVTNVFDKYPYTEFFLE